ncbi:MAG: hypothetical protein PVJ02_16460 [Gemmatimonadota bacterium]
MKRIILTMAAALTVGACGSGAPKKPAQTVDRDTLTRRQKDSIVSTMPLPGASKIGDAQRAVDKLNEQAAALDSIH